jgi:very-short-patch-repair endonuclease
MHARLDDLFDRSGLVLVADHPELATTLRRLLAAGDLARPFPGVYLRREALDEELWLRALSAWAPRAALHGHSAAALWLGDPLPRPVELANARALRRCREVRFMTRRISPEVVVQRAGLRLVSPAYAFAELAALDDGRAAERGFRQHLVTPHQVAEAARHLVGTPGNAKRKRVISELVTNPWSAAERRLHRLLRSAGLTGWVANQPIRVGGQWVAGDVRFDAERVIIEVDGFEYHSAAGAFQRDRERQNLLALAGFLVLRYTWDQLERPELVLQQVRSALRGRKP